ncbi:MAG: hypothetical protein AAF316_01090 [Cyanobacteria bacterium P01_A01_bin.80]
MAQVQQKVYLISEEQRNALLNYLLNRPYKEVASGVEFLNNAPTTTVNIEVPDEELKKASAEEESPNQGDRAEEFTVEPATAKAEDSSVFSHV